MDGPEEAVAKEKGYSHWEGIVIVKNQIWLKANGAVHDSQKLCGCAVVEAEKRDASGGQVEVSAGAVSWATGAM